MCSETSSPRISFSSDLVQEEDGTSRRDTSLLLESNSDFEFSICSSVVDHQSCSADELFAGGMILPVLHQIRERIANPTQNPHLKPLPRPVSPEQSSNKEIMVGISDQLVEKPQSKSFWGFKRSSSLNCDIKKSLICSLPLLSRSNSTGSSMPNSKKPSLLKDTHMQNSLKQLPNSLAKSSSTSSSSASGFVYSLPHKPPLKKNGFVYSLPHKPPLKKKTYVRISPVLNVPPYISKGTANLFGLGSLLRNGKEKRCRN